MNVPGNAAAWQLPDDFGVPPLSPLSPFPSVPQLAGPMENDNVRAIIRSVNSTHGSPRLQIEDDVESLSDQLADFLGSLTEEDMQPARDFLQE